MGKINMGRVLMGGIAAGIVIDAGEAIANLWLLAEQLAPVMESLGLPEPSGAAIGLYNLMGIGIGITIAWLYAAIRPRFGPGAGTAVCAGLVAWTLFSLFGVVNWAIGGALPWGVAFMIMLYQGVEFIAAGYVAGMLYQE